MIGPAVVALCAAAASAVPFRCTIVDDHFQSIAARVTRIADDRVEYVDEATGRATTLPLARLVRLETAAPPRPPRAEDGGFAFILRDGQRWYGSPGAIAGDDIECRAGGNAVAAPLKAIEAIVSVSELPRYVAGGVRRPTQDELQLANGDALVGVVAASDAERVTVQSADGTQVPAAWSSVRRAILAPVSDGASAGAPPPARFRIHTADGAVRDDDSIRFDDAHGLTVSDRRQTLTVPTADVQSIEYAGGNVRLLSRIAPAARIEEPYFPRVAGPSVPPRASEAIVIAGHASRSYVAVRPRSVLTWTLDGSRKRFVTRYGIPDGLPLADVTLRIRLDGKVVHERAGVKSGALSDLISIDLTGARSLSLEADFGENYDVQDEAFWIDPALSAE